MCLAKMYNNNKELAKVAKVHEYPARLAIEQCRRFSVPALKSAMIKIADYDTALKSGTPHIAMMSFCREIYTTK